MDDPVTKLVKATAAKALADAGGAALDGALKQAPMLDALLNGKPVDILVSPIRIQMAEAK